MIGILILAGVIAAFWIVQTVVGKTTDAAARAVFKKGYQTGRSEMHRRLAFQSPSSASDLADAVVAEVNAHTSPPAIADGLYLSQRSEDSVTFAFGSKGVDPVFSAKVEFVPTESGSSGTFRVTGWKEQGGFEVLGHKRIAPLIGRVSAAVTELGGTVKEIRNE